MSARWVGPERIDAHLLLRRESLTPLTAGASPEAAIGARRVDDVFHRGLIANVLDAPADAIDTRLDAMLNRLPRRHGHDVATGQWDTIAQVANRRRRNLEPLSGLTPSAGRALLASDVGRYLVYRMPFEDRARRNDQYELLYFRDSGIHRRLIERSYTASRGDIQRAGRYGVPLVELRRQRLQAHEPSRWEAFVVTNILELIGHRCTAFSYRHDETEEIDLILEWQDRSPEERWAIEVTSRKFDRHPAAHFPSSCAYLGIAEENRFVVFRDDDCSGGARARGGVSACALPRMLSILSARCLAS